MLKIVFILLFGVQIVQAQVKPDSVWMNQKYSMFIHWGLYAQLGGVWQGKPVENGYSEQIQSHGGIFSDWYAEVAREFNPVKWNADSIVQLAKMAGMKSIVFTSKHHDGFCMYHSAYTSYNIVDATPFGRDVMKELAEACRRQGIRFGVYFSLIDWHFPQAYPISSHNADPLTPEHYRYNLQQVEEIMTAYGDISEIWFDMGSLTPEQSRGLYDLVNRLQPHCMISGRLGNDCSDFSVMADNEYPDYKIGVPWQTAASFFNETWGYRSWQERGKAEDKYEEKIRSLIKVVSRGGNYLLNIGPQGDGAVVPFEKEVLLKMGRWLKVYGEAIYGAAANPFDRPFEWGDVTVKNNCLYLFIEKGKIPERIVLEGLRGEVEEAVCMAGGAVCFAREKGEWTLWPGSGLPDEGPVNVIRVKLGEAYHIVPLHSLLSGGVLSHENAVPVYAYSAIDYYTGFRSVIAYNWKIKTSAKQLKPEIWYTDQEKGKRVVLKVDGREHEILLEGGKPVTVKQKPLKWGSVYTKPAGSLLGSIPVVEVKEGKPQGKGWSLQQKQKAGKKITLPFENRRSWLVFQEIQSGAQQEVAVEIGSGNGVMVLLNGEVLTTHTAGRGTDYRKEIVVLPLKKGKNEFLLKFYNRFEDHLCYSVTPLETFVFYRLQAPVYEVKPADWHDCSLYAAHPSARNSEMRLNNVRIKLKN